MPALQGVCPTLHDPDGRGVPAPAGGVQDGRVEAGQSNTGEGGQRGPTRILLGAHPAPQNHVPITQTCNPQPQGCSRVGVLHWGWLWPLLSTPVWPSMGPAGEHPRDGGHQVPSVAIHGLSPRGV